MSSAPFTNASRQRIFSGIQPSGQLTLGNYLGALKRFVALQNNGIETIYCVVDLHAITVWQDPVALRQNTRELTAAFIACGLDAKKSVLFNQSQVPAHAQLGWILNTVVRLGDMKRMTQFKDKAGKNSEHVSLGLFAYPALMAADILLYKATGVPVGDDQKQHLELTRKIAEKFNHDYDCKVFPLPEPMIEGAGMRVMSLRDGSKKMSKSDPSDLSRINLSDDADTIAKKIRKAKTDAESLPDNLDALDGRAEARNLINIFAGLADKTAQQVLDEFAGKDFANFKPELADLAVAKLSPITARINELMQDPAQIDAVLCEGAQKARDISTPVLNEVMEIVGLISKS